MLACSWIRPIASSLQMTLVVEWPGQVGDLWYYCCSVAENEGVGFLSSLLASDSFEEEVSSLELIEEVGSPLEVQTLEE